jgi:ketosteroid isomerase-like protein
MKNHLLRLQFFSLVLFLVATVNAFAQSTKMSGDEKTKTEIRRVLETQTAAWNRGSVEDFMAGYWKSENLVFISGDTVRRGWQTVTDNYKKNYNTREKMGTLTFSELEITLLSKDSAVVLGRWKVQHEPKDDQGRFTLIFRKFKDCWKIVHDHTS